MYCSFSICFRILSFFEFLYTQDFNPWSNGWFADIISHSIDYLFTCWTEVFSPVLFHWFIFSLVPNALASCISRLRKRKPKKKKSTKSQVDPLERSSKLDWQKSKKQSRELKPVWMKMVTALPTLCKHKENWACQQSGYKYQDCEFEASLIWVTQQVPGQPELYNETWSQKTTTRK